MAQGFLATLSSPCSLAASTSMATATISALSVPIPRSSYLPLFLQRCLARRCICKSSVAGTSTIDVSRQREAFSRRMEMAGLKPRHRLALGVSGGPDSISLCLLAAHWKTHFAVARDSDGYIEGLLAIIVDHGLRLESKEEAEMVSHRVSNLGIRCEVVSGDWSNGRPKQGHLQEAARDLRYQTFQEVCVQRRIGVLLVAHHADDQAELFILRLSRNSGILGLAGMAFTSQLYPALPLSIGDSLEYPGMILVRPLLDLTKEELYEICKENNQKWVEDPTNSSQLFARNRIRMALTYESSCTFKTELQRFISTCRRVRTYVDSVCKTMVNQAVQIIDYGYAVVDLKLLDPLKRHDICLSKFLASVLQFISQRHRPVRGSASKLLLDYIRIFPCQTSLTAAGCYLCPAPGSKGARILVCCSVDSVLPSKMRLCSNYFDKKCGNFVPPEVEEIIMEGKSCLEQSVLEPTDESFLNDLSSDAVLEEAKRLEIISEPTYRSINEIRMHESDRFKPSNAVTPASRIKEEGESITPLDEMFQPGQSCYFMNRFSVTWSSSNGSVEKNRTSHANDLEMEVRGASPSMKCSLCANGKEMAAKPRHMVEDDWLHLAQLSKDENSKMVHDADEVCSCETTISDYTRLSAQKALASLKSIPAAARRGLPVLISPEGLLLSIPSIGFRRCPCLTVSAEFKPRVPLGGGHSSFI